MILVEIVAGLLVAGSLAGGVWFGATVLRDRPALLLRAGQAEIQVAALDARLGILQTQYETEKQLWAAAFTDPDRGGS
jgi:hypothetical protein